MNLSYITLSGRTKLLNTLNLTFGASYDPYSLNEDGQRINQLYFSEHHKPGRLTTANATASFSLRSLTNKERKMQIILHIGITLILKYHGI